MCDLHSILRRLDFVLGSGCESNRGLRVVPSVRLYYRGNGVKLQNLDILFSGNTYRIYSFDIGNTCWMLNDPSSGTFTLEEKNGGKKVTPDPMVALGSKGLGFRTCTDFSQMYRYLCDHSTTMEGMVSMDGSKLFLFLGSEAGGVAYILGIGHASDWGTNKTWTKYISTRLCVKKEKKLIRPL